MDKIQETSSNKSKNQCNINLFDRIFSFVSVWTLLWSFREHGHDSDPLPEYHAPIPFDGSKFMIFYPDMVKYRVMNIEGSDHF